MSTHTQPDTHPVLLAISAAAFVVLFVLGINFHSAQAGHVSHAEAGHSTTSHGAEEHQPVKGH